MDKKTAQTRIATGIEAIFWGKSAKNEDFTKKPLQPSDSKGFRQDKDLKVPPNGVH